MCLSNVYLNEVNEKNLIMKNIASINISDNLITLVDLMNRKSTLKGQVTTVDLLENYIVVKGEVIDGK